RAEDARGRTCALGITYKSRAGIRESQRIPSRKPRVGAPRLPWEHRRTEISTPTGVVARGGMSLAATPLGLRSFFTPISQGSSSLATLGFIAEARWASATKTNAKTIAEPRKGQAKNLRMKPDEKQFSREHPG